jgi:hypothetical protein
MLAVTRLASAQTISLAEKPGEGDCCLIKLEMQLTGELRVVRNGETVAVPLKAVAGHTFHERLLLVESNGLPLKAARCYDGAKATVTVGTTPDERKLHPGHETIVAQRVKDQVVVFCPKDRLTRPELELVGEHLDTLSITGLLPANEVKVGETWKVGNLATAGMCGLEGLVSQDLTGKLESADDDEARISINGTVGGIDLGAQVKQTVSAVLKYDRKQHRLAALEWKQKDEREQGPASPTSIVETVWKMTRQAEEEPASLANYALVAAKVDVGADSPAPEALELLLHDLNGKFLVACERDWHTVSQTDHHLILRLVDRGDLVAQVTISPWTKAAPGEHLTPDEFKTVLSDEPGWEPTEVREDGEVPSTRGLWVYRVSALGELDGLKVLQTHYLVANARGEQVVLAFTLRPALAEKMGTRDLKLVEGVDFEAPAKEPAKP